jgi:hypothetical protein
MFLFQIAKVIANVKSYDHTFYVYLFIIFIVNLIVYLLLVLFYYYDCMLNINMHLGKKIIYALIIKINPTLII